MKAVSKSLSGSASPRRRIKYIMRANMHKLSEATGSDVTLRYLDISSVDSLGRVVATELVPFGKAPSRARRLPRVGDTIVSTVRTYLQAIALIDENVAAGDGLLTCSTGFSVLTPMDGIDPRFAAYALRSAPVIDEVSARSVGVSYPAINPSDLVAIEIPTPDLMTQKAVVHFLDRKTAAIDALIAKKERLIELLQEKRQALITQAVTKGLDPNVPMKDSGIEWIGEIPAAWETSSVKRAARGGYKTFTDGDWIETPFIRDEGVRLLQTGNIGIGEYREKGFRFVSTETLRLLSCTEVAPGDVLICRLDGPVGRACRAPDLGGKMITSVDNAILKPSRDFDARFVVYCMSSKRWLDWLGSLCRVGGGHRLRISRLMLGELKIPAPPRHVQEVICNRLDEESERVESVVAGISVQVEKLGEYRQALITAAVTGQIDVAEMEAAAS